MLGRSSGAMTDPPADVFLLPGPVKMDPRVLEAMARPAMNHRGSEFKEILADVRTLTQYLFGTKGEIAVLSGSGTAGLEAAVTAFLIVDGITAVGGLENQMDAWGIDALVMGSQKCLAAPAGLSAVALSKRAYDSLHSDTSFYTNLKAHVDALAKQDTPYTPAVPL